MTFPDEVDPVISEHVIAIRNRSGVDGLRTARRLIDIEIAIFDDAYVALPAAQTTVTEPPRQD